MRIVALVLLILVSCSAGAAWEPVSRNSAGAYTVYMDYSTIRRFGSTVIIWEMTDYKDPRINDGRRYLSMITQMEYDCGTERNRMRYAAIYSENMGEGKPFYVTGTFSGVWGPIAPGRTVGRKTFDIACGNIAISPERASDANPAFDVVNGSAETISAVRASPVESDTFGRNMLSGPLGIAERFRVRLPGDGRCRYDVRVDYVSGFVEFRKAQNICDVGEIVFNGSDRRPAQAARSPAGAASPAAPAPRSSVGRGVSYGTAFFVSPLGHALTNSHVAEGCRSIVALLDTGPQPAQFIRRDSQNDLALIRVQSARAVPFASFRALPAIRAGEGVVAAGYPLPTLLQNGLNITLGNVSALAGLGGNASFMQMTAPVQPGNSGGPLLDMAGSVVGVVVGKLNASRIAQVTGDIPQNVNFAVQGALARLFLEAGGINVTENPSDTERRVGDVSDLARTFTFQVECRP